MPTALSNGWLVSAMLGPRDVYPRWEVLPMWVAEQTGVNWTVLKRWRTCWGSKQKPPDAEGSNFSQTYLYNQGEAREYITHTSKCSLACGSHCPWGTQKFRMEKQTMVRWVGRSMTGPPWILLCILHEEKNSLPLHILLIFWVTSLTVANNYTSWSF